MMFPGMSVEYVICDEGDLEAFAFVQRLEAAIPPPEVPPPCWDGRPIDADRCHEATRAMCAGQ